MEQDNKYSVMSFPNVIKGGNDELGKRMQELAQWMLNSDPMKLVTKALFGDPDERYRKPYTLRYLTPEHIERFAQHLSPRDRVSFDDALDLYFDCTPGGYVDKARTPAMSKRTLQRFFQSYARRVEDMTSEGTISQEDLQMWQCEEIRYQRTKTSDMFDGWQEPLNPMEGLDVQDTLQELDDGFYNDPAIVGKQEHPWATRFADVILSQDNRDKVANEVTNELLKRLHELDVCMTVRGTNEDKSKYLKLYSLISCLVPKLCECIDIRLSEKNAKYYNLDAFLASQAPQTDQAATTEASTPTASQAGTEVTPGEANPGPVDVSQGATIIAAQTGTDAATADAEPTDATTLSVAGLAGDIPDLIDAAVQEGFVRKTESGYQWTYKGGNASLAYFIANSYETLNVTPQWKIIEELFGVNNLQKSYGGAMDAKKPQTWRAKIDALIVACT